MLFAEVYTPTVKNLICPVSKDKIYPDEGLSPMLQLARHQHPKFGQIMAEYSVAAVINIERNMDTIKRNQMDKIWCKRYNSSTNSLFSM